MQTSAKSAEVFIGNISNFYNVFTFVTLKQATRINA